MKQTILLMCLSLSFFMSCNNDHETDLLSTKSQDEVKTLSFFYHDTFYTSSYTGDLSTNTRIVNERVKNIYDEIQSREELAFIEKEDGIVEYFDSQDELSNAVRLSFSENSISTRSSSGRVDPTQPVGTTKSTLRKGNSLWTILTTVDPNNSNKYYVKVTGNDATKRRVARGDGGYIYPRNNKDRPEAKIGTTVPPFSAYVEVYEYTYSVNYDIVAVKSIIPDYSAGGMMYKEMAGQKIYAELDTYISTSEKKIESIRKPGTFYTEITYTLKTHIYNFLLGGGTRFTGFYPFTKENATIVYWIEYVPVGGSTSGRR